MAKGRQADSARRRQRVIAAIDKAATDGTEISVSAVARAAAVDRTFFYRHRDLLSKIHALEASTPPHAICDHDNPCYHTGRRQPRVHGPPQYAQLTSSAGRMTAPGGRRDVSARTAGRQAR